MGHNSVLVIIYSYSVRGGQKSKVMSGVLLTLWPVAYQRSRLNPDH